MLVLGEKKFQLGEFALEPTKRELTRGHQAIHLASRPFQVLIYLIEHHGQLVARGELLDRFWDGKDVYDEALTKCVGAIRKALDDREERFIETRYSEGYRYVGPLQVQASSAPGVAEEIERIRGVRVVVEEEDILEIAEANDVQIGRFPSGVRKSRSRGFRHAAAAALIPIALLTTATAFIAYRNHSRAGAAAVIPSSESIESIAVLPLKNLSGNSEEDYFSDGLTDSLITELSKIKGLKVISRSSVFALKGKEIEPSDVGKKLGVAAILEGSVLRSGKNLRIEVRLVSTKDGRVLWPSEKFDRPVDDLFAVEDEIAQGVTANLRLRIDAAERVGLGTRAPSSRAAYEDYLKGRYYWNQRTVPDSLGKAIKYFNDAIVKDPNYALAYSGLADSYLMSFWYNQMSSTEALLKARVAAEKALQLDDTLCEAHTSLAAVALNEWDWKLAQTEFTRAIELNPNYATAHHWYAHYLAAADQPAQAIEQIHAAREADPLSLPINADIGYMFYSARQYDAAIVEYKKALEMKSDFPMALEGLAQTYVASGNSKEALALIGQLPEDAKTSWIVGYVYGAAGQREQAKRVLANLEQQATRLYVSPTLIALVYTGLGDHDRALFWLEKSYRERSPDLITLRLPVFDGVRSDPRFINLASRVGT